MIIYNKHIQILTTIILLIALIAVYSCSFINIKAEKIKMDKHYEANISKKNRSYYNFMASRLQINELNYKEALDTIKTAIENNQESEYLKKEKINLLIRLKKDAEALEEIENLLKKNPKDIQLLITNGDIYLKLKNIKKAEEKFLKAIEISPQLKKIYFILADIYTQANDFNNVTQIYNSFIRQFPNSYEGYLMLGKLSVKAGKIKKAEKALKKALEINPDSEDTKFEIIKLLKLIGVNTKTENKQDINDIITNFYIDILQNNPGNTRAALELAYFYHTIGERKKSRLIFNQLGKQSCDNPEIMQYILALSESKLYIPALIMLEELILTAKDAAADFHYIAGLIYEELKNIKNAKKHYLQITKTRQTLYENSALRLAIIYKDQNQIEKAIQLLDKITEEGTNKDSLFFLYLGLFYEQTKQLDKAKQAILKGLTNTPKNVNLIFRLGVIYDKLGKKASCIKEMKKVIKYEPNNAQALNYIGYTYTNMGKNLAEAEKFIRKALTISQKNGYIIDSLGWVLYKKGKYQEAIIQLEIARQYVKDDPIILEHLGDAYAKKNRIKAAIQYYQESMELSKKNNTELKKKMKRLENKK
ncbi:MAG: tetratricopeptide repeat protein [Deltaproteobacteria bacterium]|nr:tetratricopeptide repeat protein [Deltaproteobacteria bacterium]